jgi:hypothetical protein
MEAVSCVLYLEDFTNTPLNGAFLDADAKCRECERSAAKHERRPLRPLDYVDLGGSVYPSSASVSTSATASSTKPINRSAYKFLNSEEEIHHNFKGKTKEDGSCKQLKIMLKVKEPNQPYTEVTTSFLTPITIFTWRAANGFSFTDQWYTEFPYLKDAKWSMHVKGGEKRNSTKTLKQTIYNEAHPPNSWTDVQALWGNRYAACVYILYENMGPRQSDLPHGIISSNIGLTVGGSVGVGASVGATASGESGGEKEDSLITPISTHGGLTPSTTSAAGSVRVGVGTSVGATASGESGGEKEDSLITPISTHGGLTPSTTSAAGSVRVGVGTSVTAAEILKDIVSKELSGSDWEFQDLGVVDHGGLTASTDASVGASVGASTITRHSENNEEEDDSENNEEEDDSEDDEDDERKYRTFQFENRDLAIKYISTNRRGDGSINPSKRKKPVGRYKCTETEVEEMLLDMWDSHVNHGKVLCLEEVDCDPACRHCGQILEYVHRGTNISYGVGCYDNSELLSNLSQKQEAFNCIQDNDPLLETQADWDRLEVTLCDMYPWIPFPQRFWQKHCEEYEDYTLETLELDIDKLERSSVVNRNFTSAMARWLLVRANSRAPCSSLTTWLTVEHVNAFLIKFPDCHKPLTRTYLRNKVKGLLKAGI